MKAYTPQNRNIWPSGALYPVCTLHLPVAELAARVGVPLDTWEEDGMGDASGFCAQLMSGPWVMVTEYAHSRKHHHVGPALEVDATVLAQLGVAGALDALQAEMGFGNEDVSWVSPDGQMAAREWLARKTKNE